MNKIAMIPAAGRGSRMLSLTDNNPKAMVPFMGKPIIGHQIDWLIENNFDKVVIVVGYQKDKLIDYVTKRYLNSIEIIFAHQKEQNGLSTAIFDGINSLPTDDKLSGKLTILLGDIIPQEKLKNNTDNFIAYSTVEDFERWCMVEIENDTVQSFYDKPKEKPPTKNNIIGIYGFGDLYCLLGQINDQVISGKVKNNEFQLSDSIIRYMKKNNKMEALEFNNFLDLGEADALSAAKKNAARFFNTIEIKDDTVVKSSVKTKKIKDEINWYEQTGSLLKNYTPKIISNGKLKSGLEYYEMEKVLSLPMQEQYVFGLLSKREWLLFFDELLQYFKLVNISFVHEEDLKKLRAANVEMFIKKTLERCDKMMSTKFPFPYYTINGKIIKNPFFNIYEILDKVDEKIISTSAGNLSILHGDLFFGNMMFDPKNADISMFDPRGEYGEYDIYGDRRYDLAKMNHSINGYYDFIINGLYSLESKGAIINYTFYDGNSQSYAKSMFDDLLILLDVDKETIELMTGLLFLTMIPLHSDNKNNQIMQFAQAAKFLEKFI